jgi:hypothetical protein
MWHKAEDFGAAAKLSAVRRRSAGLPRLLAESQGKVKGSGTLDFSDSARYQEIAAARLTVLSDLPDPQPIPQQPTQITVADRCRRPCRARDWKWGIYPCRGVGKSQK